MSLLTVNADLSRVAEALEGILDVLRVVYRDQLEPPARPPKPKGGKLFVQTPDNLLQLEEEEARRAAAVDWNGEDAPEGEL